MSTCHFQAAAAHAAVEETADGAREMILELIQTLEDTAASSGIVTVLVDNLSKAIARVSNKKGLGSVLVFVEISIY